MATQLQHLPNELLLLICSFLHPQDLCFSVAPTCKAFAALTEDDALWRRFGHERWEDSIVEGDTWKGLYLQWIRAQAHHLLGQGETETTTTTATNLLGEAMFEIGMVGQAGGCAGKTQFISRYAYGVMERQIPDFAVKRASFHGLPCVLMIYDVPTRAMCG